VQALLGATQLALRVGQADEDPAAKLSSRRVLCATVIELAQCSLQQSRTHCRMHVTAGGEALGVECLGALER
jgi:hypothetical protein